MNEGRDYSDRTFEERITIEDVEEKINQILIIQRKSIMEDFEKIAVNKEQVFNEKYSKINIAIQEIHEMFQKTMLKKDKISEK